VYFHRRNRAFSPAISEARCRPFRPASVRIPFNTLNAVLSLIRKDPKRAEGALEDLAGVIRTVMVDNRQLIALGDELSLCRQYLNLERCAWGIAPGRLALDPAIEEALVRRCCAAPCGNASTTGSTGNRARRDSRCASSAGTTASGCNWRTISEDYQHRQGNHMALANIASAETPFRRRGQPRYAIADGRYEIGIAMPYRNQPMTALGW